MSTESNQAFGGPEDEDLFDFPVSPAYSAAGAAGDTAPQDEPVALDAEPEAAPAPQATEAPAATPEPQPVEPVAAVTNENTTLNEVDFDLDEDLFNFGPLFDATQPLSSPRRCGGHRRPRRTRGARSGCETRTSRPGCQRGRSGPPRPAPAPAQAPAAPAATPAAATPSAAQPTGAAPALAPVATDEYLASAMAPPAGADWSPEPKRGKLIEILALSFLVLNTAMIVLAWRAGSDFRETLAAVTRTVTDSVAEGHAQGQLRGAASQPQDTQASVPVNPEVTETNVDSGADQGNGTQNQATSSNGRDPSQEPPSIRQPEQAPSDLLDMPQASLELAMERIEAGRYTEARRGLFRLLANRDRTALSDEMVAQAELLIARAFAAQAEEVNR